MNLQLRTRGYLNINHLLIYIKGIKDAEKKMIETRKMFTN